MNDASSTPTTPAADPNPSSDRDRDHRRQQRRRRQQQRQRRREDAIAIATAGAATAAHGLSDQSEEESSRQTHTLDGDGDGDGARPGSDSRAQRSSLSQTAKEGLAQKLRFLNHLVYTLDTLVHAELCVLYYMDCSFFRLAIRWVAQSLFISPRSEESFLNVPNYHVSAIIAPNVICILLHLVTSLPFAGEASRGYLHGGVFIDFIGQKAPTSRLSLLLLDFMIFGLQCLMVAVNMEKEKIRKIVKPPRVVSATAAAAMMTTDSTGAAAPPAVPPPTTTQDHDAEERGVLRDAPTLDDNDGIEMQRLRGGDEAGTDERANLLGRSSTEVGREYDGLLDVLRSGNAILSTFNVRQALRDTWNNRGNTPESAAAYAIQNVGYNATLAALAAQRRARLAAAAHQR